MSQAAGETAPQMGHRAVIPPTVNPPVDRVDEGLLQRFAKVWLPDLSDAVGQLYTMDPAIRPFYSPIPRLIGQALTVKAPAGDNLAIHGALTMCRPGDVLVVDWRGFTDACATGASSLVAPRKRGLRGAIVDGAWRDIGELRSMQFPVFARCASAFSPPKDRWGEVNVPVSCGGVVVGPGDIIVGDEEGVVVIPLKWAEGVIDSVKPYEGPAREEDYTPERIAADLGRRHQRFKAIHEEYGATVPDFE